MTARDDRPAPVLLPDGGIAISGSVCAEIAAALTEYALLLRGARLPAHRRGAQLSRPMAGLLLASREGAARFQAQEHAARALAAPTVPPVSVVGPAQLPSQSETEEITTAQAADAFGFTPEWWRQLAVRGTIRSRQIARGTWLLVRADVVAYHERARRLEDRSARYRNDDQPGSARTAC